MERVDTIVVGAGVVGLAIARELAVCGREVIVLDAESAFGTQTSSRNSEVIHAGIYYPDGSAKARLCVAGKEALYAWCATAGVPHARCGKLIVAADEAQLPVLERIAAQARRNGVHDLRRLDAKGVASMEPELAAVGALWSPSTGIIDSHALMLSLLGDAEKHGAALAVRSRVTALRDHGDGLVVEVRDEDNGSETELQAGLVVNSAGHGAVALAGGLHAAGPDGGGLLPPDWAAPEAFFTKGNYFRLTGRSPFSRLVYPVPEPGGLGIHLTLDLGGQARFGPDVEPVDAMHYPVDPARGDRFYAAIRRYWPGLPDAALAPDYSGMRPRFRVEGHEATDFRIERFGAAPWQGLVNLFGIESPGLTSCLAIAREVARIASR